MCSKYIHTQKNKNEAGAFGYPGLVFSQIQLNKSCCFLRLSLSPKLILSSHQCLARSWAQGCSEAWLI